MAKGMFRTLDGLAMVDYGKRRAAISRALYKAFGYRPAYEKLEPEAASPVTAKPENHRAKKTSAVQRPYSRAQNWLRDDSKGGIVETYNQQPKTRDDIVEAYERKSRTR